jgi:hypothetical protein
MDNYDTFTIESKIKYLLESNPDLDLRYKKSDKYIGKYICSLWKDGKYYLGIKGPCTIEDCYELLKSGIKMKYKI